MTTQSPIGINQPSNSEIQQMEAFKATQAARSALRPEQIAHLFVDVLTASSRAVACAERAEPFAKEIEALPTGKDLLRDVKRYAHAAAHAQYLFFTAITPPEEVDAMVETLREKRETFYADATALVRRKLLPEEMIAHFTNSIGHRAITYDVILLCNAFRAVWPQVEGKCAVTMAEVDETQKLAEKAGAIITLKEMGTRTQIEAKDQRNRSFTLMASSMDELRRALKYVRWHEGDADIIAPSLAANRGTGRKDDEEEVDLAASNGANGTAPPANGSATHGASNTAGFTPGGANDGPFEE